MCIQIQQRRRSHASIPEHDSTYVYWSRLPLLKLTGTMIGQTIDQHYAIETT